MEPKWATNSVKRKYAAARVHGIAIFISEKAEMQPQCSPPKKECNCFSKWCFLWNITPVKTLHPMHTLHFKSREPPSSSAPLSGLSVHIPVAAISIFSPEVHVTSLLAKWRRNCKRYLRLKLPCQLMLIFFLLVTFTLYSTTSTFECIKKAIMAQAWIPCLKQYVNKQNTANQRERNGNM